MENLITIPYENGTIDNINELSIDMSNLKFDCPEDKKKFYAFIFIRNTGIKSKLVFDYCSFTDKEEYLRMFLTSNIELKCSLLASTWIEILSFNDNEILLPSILNKDEISKFICRNKNLVDQVHQFINSLPLYTIYRFNETYDIGNDININEFESVDKFDFKIVNFYQLTNFDRFILLLNPNPPYEQRPVFYKELFSDRSKAYDFMNIVNNLPYMNILNAIFSNKECQNDIINGINHLFKKEE